MENGKCSDITYILLYSNYNNNLSCDKFIELIDILKEHYAQYQFIICKRSDDVELLATTSHLLICNYYHPVFDRVKLPIIICDRMDSANINNKNYRSLCRKNISLLIKEYTYRDPKLNHYQWLENRHHYNLLENNTKLVEKKEKCDLSKIKTCSWNLYQYSFVANKSMKYMKDLSNVKKKDIDVFFVCHSHDKSPILSRHRRGILKILKKFESETNAKCVLGVDINLKKRKYMDTIKRSKICVCPYGLGGRIALDQFALLAESIVVKPDMSYMMTDPMIYTKQYMEFFTMDNLKSVLANILGNYEKYNKLAKKRKKMVLKFDDKYYADRFVETIQEVL